MKQTAVEWLAEVVAEMGYVSIEILDQAKAMEKEQMFEYIKKNYVNGEHSLKFHKEEFEKYHNETFKSE